MQNWDSFGAPVGAKKPAATGPGAKPSAARDKQAIAAEGKVRGAIAVERQLKRIRELYNKNFKGVGPGSLIEYLPTQSRRQFDAAANNLRPLLKPLIRDPGEGSFTEGDQALLDQLIPQGGMQDAENEERFRGLEAMVADARRNAGVAKPITPTIRRIK